MVFVGLVVETVDTEDGYTAKFQVEEAFRGVNGPEVDVSVGATSCLYPFEEGHRYLVFAQKNEESKRIWTSMCSRTSPLEEVEDRLPELRKFQQPHGGGRIFGTVLRIPCDRAGSCSGFPAEFYEEDSTPLPGVLVKAAGGGVVLEGHANGKGHYEIVGMPPGKYKVTTDLPPSLTNESQEVEIFDGSCAQLDFLSQSNGRIRGRLLDDSGTPVREMVVELIPADPASAKNYDKRAIDVTEEDGNFEFGPLPPGQYFVGVNLTKPPDPEAPFPTTYYPGVPEEDKAIPLDLGEGQHLSDIEVRLPLPLRKVPVQVTVVWHDGRPAANVGVEVWPRDKHWSWFLQRTDAHGRAVVNLFEGETYRIDASVQLEINLQLDINSWGCARAISVDASGAVPPVTLVLRQHNDNCPADDPSAKEK